MPTWASAVDMSVTRQWVINKAAGSSSVKRWLTDLQLTTDSECMSILQGKSVAKDTPLDSTVVSVRGIKEGITSVQTKARMANAELSKLLKRIDRQRWKQVKSGCVWLTHLMRSTIHECNTQIPEGPQCIYQEEDHILSQCAKLVETTEQAGIESTSWETDLAELITQLGQSFSTLVDMVLGLLIQGLIEIVDSDSSSAQCLTMAIGQLISLGLEGDQMCFIIAREKGVRVLLDICQRQTIDMIKAQALRAVATVSCVSESITELDEVNGIGSLTEILCSEALGEMVRSEAAGVVAQITSPSLEHYQHVTGFIENLCDLVGGLTDLCLHSSGPETFLLAAAALANLTFVDPLACDFLQQFDTVSVLITAAYQSKATSLFAKDQVATVLANMATSESNFESITTQGGVPLLVNFLRETPGILGTGSAGSSPLHKGGSIGTPLPAANPEVSACERVQQKAAIALTRLAKDPHIAAQVVKLKGLEQLIKLCRDPGERNGSDAVLVASLAALRKINAECIDLQLSPSDLEELVNPKLMDSFLLCTRMNESFV